MDVNRLLTLNEQVIMQPPCGIRCPNSHKPATLMCAQCLVYYHPACVNLNDNLKIVGYVCINCRSLVRQRNRRVQSSHTVVVGASEPEQSRVKPIRIQQFHQELDIPNFFVDKTTIFKTEEPDYEIDEHIYNENDSDITTVTCQGHIYKTVMVDDRFYEQYVYEMKQTQGPSLMTCVVQEPKNLDENSEINYSLKEHPVSIDSMQSFNYMVIAMRHVFKYLRTHELLLVSRVCIAWNIIAMNRDLWQTVHLKSSMVCNWNKSIAAIHSHGTVTLDTRRMLIPTKIEEFNKFWLDFTIALKIAQKLKCIELYKCPVKVVEDTIYSLPQLTVLNATSIKNPDISKEKKNHNNLMVLNLQNLSQLVHLTELRIKGLTGLKLTSLPSFENLVNLKSLSITSIKEFPKDVCRSLETVTTNLTLFEIGDCDCLTKDFVGVLKRLTSLTSLRLEKCCGGFDSFAQEVFCSIRGLDKLNILELINIEFNYNVENELEKCDGIKALLIIPMYDTQSATTNCHLVDCLKKLSNTLTHLVWGLTYELFYVTNEFIQFPQNKLHNIGYNLDLSYANEGTNNIPILRTKKPRQRPEEESITYSDKEIDELNTVDILSVPALEQLLETMMENTEFKIVEILFASITKVHLLDHFNDL